MAVMLPRRLAHGLAAVLGSVLLIVGLPWALTVVSERRFGARNPVAGIRPPWAWTSADVGDTVRRPLEDDTVVDLIVRGSLVIVWLTIAVVVATTVLELVHLVRHRGVRSPHRRGLGWAQPTARFIASGLIALLPLSATASDTHPLAPLLTAAPRATGPGPTPTDLDAEDLGIEWGHRSGPARWAPPGDATPRTEPMHLAAGPLKTPRHGERVHVVARGESVWSIAAMIAEGDDADTVRLANAILDRNLGRRMADGSTFTSPALIQPGWELLVPDAVETTRPPIDRPITSPSTERTVRVDDEVGYIVQEGDTLSSIADTELGETAAWTTIAERNMGRTMNDGRVFDDPDLILPGWELELGTQPPDHSTTPAIDPLADTPGAPGASTEVDLDDDGREQDADPELAGAPVDDPPVDGEAPVDDRPPAVSRPEPVNDQSVLERETDWFDDRLDDEMPPPVVGPAADAVPATSPAIDGTVPQRDVRVDADEQDPGWSATPPATTMPASATSTTPPATTMANSATSTTPPASTMPASATSTTTTTAVASTGTPSDEQAARPDSTTPSSPLRIDHAAMLAGGLLTLAAVRRRRRLRSAPPRARIPEPAPGVIDTERTLRTIGSAERRARLDVAVRALARQLVGSGAQPVVILHTADSRIQVLLSAPASLVAPWTPSSTDSTAAWTLPASIPIELLADDARSVGHPCPSLVAIGESNGDDVLVDLEAAGVLEVNAPAELADQVVSAIASTTATSLAAETAHLIAVGLDEAILFGHPNASTASDAATAIAHATALVGSPLDGGVGTFDLRSRRTGGEAWEPAVVFVSADAAGGLPWDVLPERGRGLAVVVATTAPEANGVRLVAGDATWRIEAFGSHFELSPYGLTTDDVDQLVTFVAASDVVAEPPIIGEADLIVDANPTSIPDTVEASEIDDGSEPAGVADGVELGDRDGAETPSVAAAATGDAVADVLPGDEVGRHGNETARDHVTGAVADPAIIVRVLGGVVIGDRTGTTHAWQRSKTVELIAWLATHRNRSSRSAARTAMWDQDVRDATFSNVVSEARRGLARLLPPPDGEEWIPRTMTDELSLHPTVVTDIELLDAALDAARLATPDQAIELLRPVVAGIDGLPFAETNYLWPDADGLVTAAILTATTACVELAEHALSLGDIETVFMATAHGLRVLPGHEGSIALRMRAHARRGDLAGVRQEWESYERVLTADAWSDGEPAPELLRLRRELLAP